MLPDRTPHRGGWLLTVLAGALLAGCSGTLPSSGPGKQTPPADTKPADKGKATPPEREIG